MPSEPSKDPGKQVITEDGVIPLHLLKNLRKGGAESGSSNGENNSDNSALVSIGNTSFGFNFDSEEHTPNNSDRDRNENSEDSDDQQRGDKKVPAAAPSAAPLPPQQPSPQVPSVTASNNAVNATDLLASSTAVASTQPVVPPPQNPQPELSTQPVTSHNAAAADAVANLQLIATNTVPQPAEVSSTLPEADFSESNQMVAPPPNLKQQKRKADEGDSSAGYHTDDEGRSVTLATSSNLSVPGNDEKGRGKKKKRLDERKREERNLREKERSLRISKQINELRDLLSSGGVIVPKGTKSSVLTEAANYIRMLQQHQYRSEL